MGIFHIKVQISASFLNIRDSGYTEASLLSWHQSAGPSVVAHLEGALCSPLCHSTTAAVLLTYVIHLALV